MIVKWKHFRFKDIHSKNHVHSIYDIKIESTYSPDSFIVNILVFKA